MMMMMNVHRLGSAGIVNRIISLDKALSLNIVQDNAGSIYDCVFQIINWRIYGRWWMYTYVYFSRESGETKYGKKYSTLYTVLVGACAGSSKRRRFGDLLYPTL